MLAALTRANFPQPLPKATNLFLPSVIEGRLQRRMGNTVSLRMFARWVLLVCPLALACLPVAGSAGCTPVATTARQDSPASPVAGPPLPPSPIKAAGPIPYDPRLDPEDPNIAMRNVKAAAKRTGGNFDRLEPKYQQFLDSVTGGHGRDMFRDLAKRQ